MDPIKHTRGNVTQAFLLTLYHAPSTIFCFVLEINIRVSESVGDQNMVSLIQSGSPK